MVLSPSTTGRERNSLSNKRAASSVCLKQPVSSEPFPQSSLAVLQYESVVFFAAALSFPPFASRLYFLIHLHFQQSSHRASLFFPLYFSLASVLECYIRLSLGSWVSRWAESIVFWAVLWLQLTAGQRVIKTFNGDDLFPQCSARMLVAVGALFY